MKKILALAVVLTLVGCSTPYTSNGLLGGFSESQLADNVWQVSFEGNGYTRQKKAIDYTMLRSAELTLLQGYSYFAVVDKNAFSDGGVTISNSSMNMTGSAQTFGNSTYGHATGSNFGTAALIRFPTANQTIMMFKEKPEGFMVYNAEMVCRSLGGNYGVTCESLKKTDNKPAKQSQK